MVSDYSQYGGVLVGRQDKVLTITLNSPETLNAFTGPMHTSMSRIWDDVNDDPDVHVVVLTGAGRAFSAGGNVIAMQKKIDDPGARKRVQRLMRLLGLAAIYQRPNTSKPAAAHKIYPYLLGGIAIGRGNQVWGLDC